MGYIVIPGSSNEKHIEWTISKEYVYSKLGQSLFDKINPGIKAGMQALKGTPYERIGRSIKYYTDAANFLKYYKQGIFTQEKMELINKILDKDPNALRFVNFGLFKDDIFDLGPEFCTYMSKFPSCKECI